MTSELRILQDRFRLLENLGKGGMGTVWLAEDMRLDRVVALKELIRDGARLDLDTRRERAMREAKALAKVRHPAIVSVHDVVLDAGDPWIVMEYISGRSLEAILGSGPLDEREVARYALPVLHALSAAHRAGVVHRDVKPDNILVAEDGSVSLVDFGIAQIDGVRSMTGWNTIMGTTDYVAPERITEKEAGPPSDLWSLGVTLFYALEGYLPFRRTGEQWQNATMYAIMHEDPPAPAGGGPLAGVIMKLLDKDPSRRPGSLEVEAILQRVVSGEGPAQRPARRQARCPGDPVPPRPSGTQLGARAAAAEREVIGDVGADAGAAMLLAMSARDAAVILRGYEPAKRGELFQGVAAARPARAGEILDVLDINTAAHTFSYLKSATAVSVLGAMRDADAVRILTRLISFDCGAASDALMHMPVHSAVAMLRAIPAELAARALTRVWPASAEAMSSADPDLIRRLRARRGTRAAR